MIPEPNPLPHALVGLLGVVASVYDLRSRMLPDWLTLGGIALGLAVGGATGGWGGLLGALGGAACGLGVFWLFHSLGMLGGGDVLFMGASGALLGWPLVLHGLLYAALAGGLIGLGLSLARGHLLRVFRNLYITLATTLRPGRRRVPLAELPTDELPYALAIAAGSIWAALLPYCPALSLL